MKATRKDVAQRAGVSAQTVSYIINKSRKFSKKVEDRVHQAIKELNYAPNMAAKSLVTKKSYSISVIVHDIANPIFNEIMVGLQAAARTHDYFVNVCDPHEDIDKYVQDLISRDTDAVFIYVLAMYQDISFLEKLIDCDIKIVVGGNVEIEDENIAKNISVIDANHSDGMKKILEHLKDLGHTEIAYLSGLGPESPLDFRYRAFKKHYVRLFGKDPLITENIPPYDTTSKVGYDMTKALLEAYTDVTAIVTTNDLMAFGSIEALNEKGLEVPKDISVVGIDDMMFAKYFAPPLTTLGFDKVSYGERVFKHLYGLMNNDVSHGTVLIDTNLIVRGSTTHKYNH
ncbi:MAG: LacI family transcriptional regulator [Acholeplasmataceae bacterium]|nr:LacI family transcriptional regulator [Acholeplasmataceae bacterium]